jgi:hypothetical protein
MIEGGCLCGAVRFRLARVVGPFELCHCSRCRKASGSAFVAGVGVRVEDFEWMSGAELVRVHELPLVSEPPPYRVSFCTRCGSPVPDPPASGFFEIAAGSLDGDPGLRPDKHIYVEHNAPWWRIEDSLPRFTAEEIAEHRRSRHP